MQSPFCSHFTGHRQTSAGRSYVLTFNVRLTATPAYLNSLISKRVTASIISFRSLTRSLMAVPRTNTECTSSSFSVCDPVEWNSLPPDIQLCSCLKTLNSKLLDILIVFAPLTSERSQNAPASLDFMALYTCFHLLTYLLTYLLTIGLEIEMCQLFRIA